MKDPNIMGRGDFCTGSTRRMKGRSTHWWTRCTSGRNLEVAWEKVKRNRGAGGVDGEDLATFEASLDARLDRLHRELRDGEYVPQPVLQHFDPQGGPAGKFRPLGIPTIYDRVCQQAY